MTQRKSTRRPSRPYNGRHAQAMTAPNPPLLATKLYAPAARPNLVPRPRLTACLAEGAALPLTIISAPAGFGKTTLISEWRAENPDVPLAWVALDEGNNDPLRPPLVLALDDYHVISAGAVHEGLAFLLAHLPPCLRLMLAALVAGGLIFQSLSEARDQARFVMPGVRVDVGGYELHLNCAGTGGPTVVLDSGLGGPAVEWAAVQPDVARFVRVCSFDRAGRSGARRHAARQRTDCA